MAATRAHTAPSTRPCQGRLCWPCAHPLPHPWAQTLCPTSPLSSTGHMAASSSSSHDLWRIIHSLRCSLGWLALLTSLHLFITFQSPRDFLDCITHKTAEGVTLLCQRRPFSLSLGGVEGSYVAKTEPDQPTPYRASGQVVRQRETDCARRVALSWEFYHLVIIVWLWLLVPGVCSRGQGFHRAQQPYCERTSCSNGELWGKTLADLATGPVGALASANCGGA